MIPSWITGRIKSIELLNILNKPFSEGEMYLGLVKTKSNKNEEARVRKLVMV